MMKYKLSKKEVNDIISAWFELKPTLPTQITLSINLHNQNDESDDVILYNTELRITIHVWDSDKDTDIPFKVRELLKIYDMDYVMKALKIR